jgi:hypothetical protein
LPALSRPAAVLAALLLLSPASAFAGPVPAGEARLLPFEPYRNESDVVGIGPELTVENRMDRVTILGSVDLTHDEEGARKAAVLRELLERVCRALREAEPLPAQVAVAPPETVDNPFESKGRGNEP